MSHYYIVNPKHGPLSTRWGNWMAGDPFVPGPEVPPEVIKAWKAKSVIIVDEKNAEGGPEVLLIPEDEDPLTVMDQGVLIKVIRENKLNLLPGALAVKPKTSWSLEQIRQAIRDCCTPLSQLSLDGQPLSAHKPVAVEPIKI